MRRGSKNYKSKNFRCLNSKEKKIMPRLRCLETAEIGGLVGDTALLAGARDIMSGGMDGI